MNHICKKELEYTNKVDTVTHAEYTSGVLDNSVVKFWLYKHSLGNLKVCCGSC